MRQPRGGIGWSTTGFVLQKALDVHAAHLGLASPLQLSEAQKTVGLGHGYQTSFLIFAAVYVFGVACWLRIDATKPLAPEETTQDALLR